MPTHFNNLNQQLADRILKLRTHMQITQHELADYLGVPRSAISMIEANKRVLTAVEAFKICMAFNITPNELFYADQA